MAQSISLRFRLFLLSLWRAFRFSLRKRSSLAVSSIGERECPTTREDSSSLFLSSYWARSTSTLSLERSWQLSRASYTLHSFPLEWWARCCFWADSWSLGIAQQSFGLQLYILRLCRMRLMRLRSLPYGDSGCIVTVPSTHRQQTAARISHRIRRASTELRSVPTLEAKTCFGIASSIRIGCGDGGMCSFWSEVRFSGRRCITCSCAGGRNRFRLLQEWFRTMYRQNFRVRSKEHNLAHQAIRADWLGIGTAAEYQKRPEVTLSWEDITYSLKVKGTQFDSYNYFVFASCFFLAFFVVLLFAYSSFSSSCFSFLFCYSASFFLLMLILLGKQLDLIKPMHGYVKSAMLLALMGPSGAGKTTLLDILAHRKS